jgi:hypothetical protein
MKRFVIAFCLILTLSCAYVAAPAYEVHGHNVPHTETTIKTVTIGKHEVRVFRHDIYSGGEHDVSFEADLTDGRSLYQLKTDPYPLQKLLVDLLEPLSPVAARASSDPISTYLWHGIVFVNRTTNSSVFYDHPDNYDIYDPKVNDSYTIRGNGTLAAIHIPKYAIEDAKQKADLGAFFADIWGLILDSAGSVVAGPLAFLGVVVLVLEILESMCELISIFLNQVLQSELGDGWMYLWDPGSWWFFRWIHCSFGAWRDWGWYLVWLNIEAGGGGSVRGIGAISM